MKQNILILLALIGYTEAARLNALAKDDGDETTTVEELPGSERRPNGDKNGAMNGGKNGGKNGDKNGDKDNGFDWDFGKDMNDKKPEDKGKKKIWFDNNNGNGGGNFDG